MSLHDEPFPKLGRFRSNSELEHRFYFYFDFEYRMADDLAFKQQFAHLKLKLKSESFEVGALGVIEAGAHDQQGLLR